MDVLDFGDTGHGVVRRVADQGRSDRAEVTLPGGASPHVCDLTHERAIMGVDTLGELLEVVTLSSPT